jgi:hypothetical protein
MLLTLHFLFSSWILHFFHRQTATPNSPITLSFNIPACFPRTPSTFSFHSKSHSLSTNDAFTSTKNSRTCSLVYLPKSYKLCIASRKSVLSCSTAVSRRDLKLCYYRFTVLAELRPFAISAYIGVEWHKFILGVFAELS